MLVADDVAHCTGLHPFEGIKARGVATNEDAIDQARCLVISQRLGQHRADVLIITNTQTGLAAHGVNELIHHIGNFVLADVLHLGHGHAHTLNFLWPHMLEDLSGVRFAQ